MRDRMVQSTKPNKQDILHSSDEGSDSDSNSNDFEFNQKYEEKNDKGNIKKLTSNLINDVSSFLLQKVPNTSNKGSRRQLKRPSKAEKLKEYGILNQMVPDIHKMYEFRYIQNKSYLFKENVNDFEDVFEKIMSMGDSSERDPSQKFKDYRQQIEFIQGCKESKSLPLPLLKKIKFGSLVLDNYQINSQVAKAFGRSMHYFGTSIQSITLSNNNMKDEDVAVILQGCLTIPISFLTIQHNKLDQKSIEMLIKIIKKREEYGGRVKKMACLKTLEVNN